MPGGGDGLMPLLLGAVLPSSQFAEEHLGEPMNLSSPCAFARLPLRAIVPVPAPLAVGMLAGTEPAGGALAAHPFILAHSDNFTPPSLRKGATLTPA